jgi:hypothetical protein
VSYYNKFKKKFFYQNLDDLMVKNLIKEEWKRLFVTYENINNEMENEKNK